MPATPLVCLQGAESRILIAFTWLFMLRWRHSFTGACEYDGCSLARRF